MECLVLPFTYFLPLFFFCASVFILFYLAIILEPCTEKSLKLVLFRSHWKFKIVCLFVVSRENCVVKKEFRLLIVFFVYTGFDMIAPEFCSGFGHLYAYNCFAVLSPEFLLINFRSGEFFFLLFFLLLSYININKIVQFWWAEKIKK